MRNIKTTIFGAVAVAFLAGIVWYAGNYGLDAAQQAASVLGGGGEEQDETVLMDEFFLGNPDASVTLIEYSGHFCGACSFFHKNTLPLIIDEYVTNGKVKIIPRLPAPFEMGMAVLCAQEQGKFWELNEHLFENARNFKEINDIKLAAADLGLNQEEFDLCFDSERHIKSAERWLEQAQESGIEGTPTFFINGEMIVGNQPYSVFKNAIEKALAE